MSSTGERWLELSLSKSTIPAGLLELSTGSSDTKVAMPCCDLLCTDKSGLCCGTVLLSLCLSVCHTSLLC